MFFDIPVPWLPSKQPTTSVKLLSGLGTAQPKLQKYMSEQTRPISWRLLKQSRLPSFEKVDIGPLTNSWSSSNPKLYVESTHQKREAASQFNEINPHNHSLHIMADLRAPSPPIPCERGYITKLKVRTVPLGTCPSSDLHFPFGKEPESMRWVG